MYALISWSSKNGVALGREELEVKSSSKLTVMNGGKMEPGATVNMQYRKDIWGGVIQSVHDDKKGADEKLENEVTGAVSNVEEVLETTEDQGSSKKSQRKRKKKSYGNDYDENDSEESDNSEDIDSTGLTCSPVLKETNGPAKKTKKVSNSSGGKENGKKQKVAEKERTLNISSQHDELMITQILGECTTSEPVQASKTVPPHPHLSEPVQASKTVPPHLHLSEPVQASKTVPPLPHLSEPVQASKTVPPHPHLSEPVQASKTIPPHPHFGGKQPKQHKLPKCISVVCKEEKEMLEEQWMDTKKELDDIRKELEKAQEELRTLKALQPSTTAIDSVKYGKLPRSVAMAKNWEEISNGVWCCPIKVKAAVKNSATRTALALALFGIFYPKEEVDGRRLHELNQDVIEAITDFSLVAKLTKEPTNKKLKEGEEPKPPSPISRSTIKQAMRMKCNSMISLQRRKLGVGLCGLLITILRIVTKTTTSNLHVSSYYYFGTAAAFIVLVIAAYLRLTRGNAFQHYYSRAPRSGVDTDWKNPFQRFAFFTGEALRVLRYKYVFCHCFLLTLVTAQQYVVIPSVATMAIDFLGNGWFPVLLILVYNIGDVLGRGPLSMYYVYSLRWAWLSTVVRFVVIIGICLSVPPHVLSDRPAWMAMFVAVLGLSTGHLTTSLISYASSEVPGRAKETVGYLSVLSITLGMAGGSAVSYGIKALLDRTG